MLSNTLKKEAIISMKKNIIKPKALGFISYAAADKPYFDVFHNCLVKILSQSINFDWHIWEFSQIELGELWDKRIQTELSKSQVGIFLLSTNFFSSTYIREKEFDRFLRENIPQDGIMIPVLFKPSLYNQWSEISERQIFVNIR